MMHELPKFAGMRLYSYSYWTLLLLKARQSQGRAVGNGAGPFHVSLVRAESGQAYLEY
jgi:hypothetical protein